MKKIKKMDKVETKHSEGFSFLGGIITRDGRESLRDALKTANADVLRDSVLVYLSAPISGIKDPLILEAQFFAMERAVREIEGAWYVNPLENGLPADSYWAEHMLADLRLIAGCDAVLMPHDTGSSVGCRIERLFAERIGVPVFSDVEELKEYVQKLNN